jgi:hypothetical protein
MKTAFGTVAWKVDQWEHQQVVQRDESWVVQKDQT